MPTALIWNHRFKRLDIAEEWARPTSWVVTALQDLGWTVLRHPDVRCAPVLNTSQNISAADLVIYTHTTEGEVRGYEGPQWFLKSTGPSQFHTTLDVMGYGPYSSIAYDKPPFEQVSNDDMREFFESSIPAWIRTRTTKWGRGVLPKNEIKEDDYILVVGQTLMDDTVAKMWFGHYLTALFNVVQLLPQVTDREIVVKLHPWTDGISDFNFRGQPNPPTGDEISQELKGKFEGISPRIKVYTGMRSIHDFLERAHCVVLCNSGSGIEALMHDKPVVSWGFPEYHWVTYDLRHLCDMHRALKLDWFDQQKARQFLFWYAERYAFNNLEGARRRVEELLDIR